VVGYLNKVMNLRVINLLFLPMALPAHSGPRPLIKFRNHFSQTVGLLGVVTARRKAAT
jgi:hypothetical protein